MYKYDSNNDVISCKKTNIDKINHNNVIRN